MDSEDERFVKEFIADEDEEQPDSDLDGARAPDHTDASSVDEPVGEDATETQRMLKEARRIAANVKGRVKGGRTLRAQPKRAQTYWELHGYSQAAEALVAKHKLRGPLIQERTRLCKELQVLNSKNSSSRTPACPKKEQRIKEIYSREKFINALIERASTLIEDLVACQKAA
jgi:hypothetical protein